MTEIILLKIALLAINLYFTYRNYESRTFNSFVSGALFANLLVTFLK